MKKRNIIIAIVIFIILIIMIVIGNLNRKDNKESDKLKIVTSFYPIYIMTINLTNGIENVEVSNMAENYVGCIHDYTLTTTDLKKFENADIFIENGYGMEQFSQKIIDSYPDVKIIDSSTKITDFVQEGDEVNPHFWTSIDNYILQVEKISEGLQELDPLNSENYKKNESIYEEKLKELKDKYNEINFSGKSVVSLNESFSYLFKFIGVNETLIETDHEQSALSAETVKEVFEEVKNTGIKAIVIAENDDNQNANLIAEETGAKVYKLNDAMNGDNSIDSYINIMNENLEILKTMFN